ncbi:MAG: hypothetical protein GY865_10920, partial [candidate division Zixibacteria bacterium]|nr:hypothetical protein [candidate division Zixibacteria bacterium]
GETQRAELGQQDMSITTPEIQTRTPASQKGKIPSGRGFYQLEEESLYLPVEYPSNQKRFYSYLDSDTVSLHFDRAGRLIFIEVNIPRRRWNIKNDFVPPEIADSDEARFLDFRKSLIDPKVFCDKGKKHLLILFDNQPAKHNIYLAKNLIAQVTSSGFLTAIWVTDIIDDMAGQKIASWRHLIHKTPLRIPDCA